LLKIKIVEISINLIIFCFDLDKGHKECLEVLLRAGANVDHLNRHGWTALCYSAGEFH